MQVTEIDIQPMNHSFRKAVLWSLAALAGLIGPAGQGLSAQTVANGTKAPSTAFERFRYSFIEDPKSAQDALDLAALRALDGAERAQAEDILLNLLPDGRGIIGLGVLRSKRAAAALVSLLQIERQEEIQADRDHLEYWSDRPVNIAKSLWYIEPTPQWLSIIINELATRPQWTTRMNAAEALLDICDPHATTALVQALDDKEALVRHHVARALLATHGLSVETRDPKHMLYRVMAKDEEERQVAVKDILKVIDGRRLCAP